MTFSIIQGDLFDPEHNFDALAQGVNTYGNMGGGIAVPFRTKWPEMYESYYKLCKKHGEALGGLIHIFIPKHTATEYEAEDGNKYMSIDFGTTIYNLFSQIQPGEDGSYALLQKATIMMLQDAESQNFERVGLPWIGCGIAGLAKHNVEFIFRELLGDSEVEFVLVQQYEIMLP